MSRRSRFRLCRRVVIGGHPVRAVTKALLSMPAGKGQVWEIGIAHDEGCGAVRHQRLDACDCEIVEITAERRA